MIINNQNVAAPYICDISNAEYHSTAGISRSALCEIKKSPLHYWEKHINPERKPQQETQAMIIGSAVHCLVLEPHLFDEDFAVLEKIDLRTKAGKEYKAKFELQAIGKMILKEEDLMLTKSIVKAVLEHQTAMLFLRDAYKEKSIFWEDEETGLLCKARPDIWNDDLKLICDLKTTNDASPEAFAYAVKDHNYHIQAAMQIDSVYAATGRKMESFCFIVAPKDKPYKPYIHELSAESIQQGRLEYKSALKILKECIETQKWDLDREKLTPLSLPFYSLNINPLQNLLEIYGC